MDQFASSRTVSTMEAELNQLVKDVNDVTNAATKEMKKLMHERFTKVRTKLYSIYGIVSKRAPKSMTVQETELISTNP